MIKLELYDKVRRKGSDDAPRRIARIEDVGGEDVYWLEGGTLFPYCVEKLELVEKWVDDGRGVELMC